MKLVLTLLGVVLLVIAAVYVLCRRINCQDFSRAMRPA